LEAVGTVAQDLLTVRTDQIQCLVLLPLLVAVAALEMLMLEQMVDLAGDLVLLLQHLLETPQQ
jgi:hypothetical protein